MNMKAEINSENKARFYNAYIGQKTYSESDFPKKKRLLGMVKSIAILSFDEEDLEILESDNISNPKNDLKILLKPLSSISDEDAIECLKILDITQFKSEKQRKDWIREAFENNMWSHKTSNVCYCADYLRSKGYALLWMGLSVKEMVEAGWIKLTQ